MIIIPDTHGRVFWKEALKHKKPGEIMIFLGDYVDPYPQEGISLLDAISNFEEILEEKKKNPDEIVLLIGNHDLMYMHPDHNKCSCRHDYTNEPKITKLLCGEETKDLYQMSYVKEICGVTYVFSHSGIHPNWVKRHENIFGEYQSIPESAKIANSLFKKKDDKFYIALLEFSYYRGGLENIGSMVWADVREHESGEKGEDSVYQIFGHTQLIDSPIIDKSFADLDCRKPFQINEETGELKELKI